MRLFEFLLWVSLFLWVSVRFIKKEKRPAWLGWLPLVSLFLVIVHLVFEGHRWQMFLVYVFTGISLLSFLLNRFGSADKQSAHQPGKLPKRRRIGSISGILLSLLLLLFSVFLGYNPPVYSPPAPSGPYEVGTRDFHLIDLNREEIATPDRNDHRSLWVKAWYPAETTTGLERALVFPEYERFLGGVIQSLGMPAFTVSHMRLVKSHSYIEAPLKTALPGFPVILYSHGYTGFISDNTLKFELLASHGYVVFSIAHAYETQLGLREDGRWLTLDDTNSFSVFSRNYPQDKAAFKRAGAAADSIRQKAASPVKLKAEERLILDSLYQVGYGHRRDRLEVWAADQAFVLDKVEKMESGEIESPFKGKLDLSRVGSFGSSFGGATAGLFNARDTRCLASVNLDGSQFGSLYAYTLNKPHMQILGQDGGEKELRNNDWEYIGNASPYYRVAVKGAKHGNMGDPRLDFFMARKLGLGNLGTIDTKLMTQITNAYILAFFDKYLKSTESRLLEGENAFEEVKFDMY